MEILFSIIAGGAIGFAYWRFIGCTSGSCSITRDKYASTITGALVGLMLVTSGCGNTATENKQTSVQVQPAVNQVADHKLGNEAFAEKMKEPGNIVLDVRTPEEFAAGHLVNAVNINVNGPTFEQEVNKLDKNKTILIYCKSGVRSEKAYEAMKNDGFTSMFTLTTGITGWKGETVR